MALGGAPALISMLLLPAGGLGLHFILDGAEAMSAEAYIWALYVLAPLGVLFVLVFLWNLISVPYKMQKDRADAAEARIREVESGTTFPTAVLKSLSDTQSRAESLDEQLIAISKLFEQYRRMLNSEITLSEGKNLDDDIYLIAQFLADQAKHLLPSLPFSPDEPIVFQVGWNTYRYMLSHPMRTVPKISFPHLPDNVRADVTDVSRFHFDVKFWDKAGKTVRILPHHFTADSRPDLSKSGQFQRLTDKTEKTQR